MLDGLVTWWRNLVGQSATGAGLPLNGGQSIWVSAQAANGLPEEEERVSAWVRNIYRNGIHLTVNHCFCPGDLIKVDLPGSGAEPPYSVLATVIHARPLDGEWSLDCVFASELDEDELRWFGAQRVKATPADRRTWVRFSCETRASYLAVSEKDQSPRAARVLDISSSGIGLVVDQAMEAGTLLSLELHGPKGDFTRKILACVVRVNLDDDNLWVLGCNFIRELAEKELAGLKYL